MTKSFLAQHAAAIVAALAIVAPASAQTTVDDTKSRAGVLSDARDQKSESLSVPKRSAIERALYWYDVNGARLQWRAFHFTGGQFSGGAGFGYGIGMTAKGVGSVVTGPDQPNRIDTALFAARSIRGYQRLSARMDVRNVAARPIDVKLRWQDYKLPQEDFYGSGSGSVESGRTNYRLDGRELSAGVSWRPSGSWTFGSEVFYLTPSIGAGTDARYPTTASLFDDTDAPGLDGLPAFVRADFSAGFDWRDSTTHPRRGGNYEATLSQYSGVDDDGYDFRRLDVSAQQIIPIANRYRRIELGAGATLTDAANGAEVPFIYQPVIGGPATLRAFTGSRFRDRNAAWARAEYQWEAWWAMDAALFIDAGQVAHDRSDFRLKAFDVAYGIGFRFHRNNAFIARLDLAYGREGFLPVMGFSYGF